MSLKKDIIGAEVQIGSNEAQKSLVDLTQKTAALTNENDRLRISQAKLKALGKESEEEYKKVSAAITENNKAIKENKSQMDALRKTIGLTEMSFPQLRKRAAELRKELLDMGDSADSAQFKKLNSELIATERQMGKLRGRIGDTKKEMNPLIDTAKQLLPAFSFAAIGSAAVSALNKIKNSTDTLSTQWDVFMGGMTSANDEFFRTLATGNWENFIGNMREAVRVGREYQSVLDELEAKQRALSIAESDAKEEIVRLEEDLRNKGLSDEQRLAAGKRRIQIEEDLAVNRSKIAKQEYESEVMMAKQASKLSDEKLQQLVRDFDSEKKMKAEALINLQDELRKLESMAAQGGASTGVLFPGMVSTSGYSDAIAQVKQQIKEFSPDVVSYASDLRLLGNVTDEQLNKMVTAYGKLKEAEVSGREGIKRVITMVNNLQAGEEGNGQKIEDKALKAKKELSDKAIAILDAAQNERTSKLVTQYESERWTDERFKVEQLAAEQAYLIQKRALLVQFGQSTVDIDNQINQKRIEAQKESNAVMSDIEKESIKLIVTQQQEDEQILAAQVDAQINATNKALASLKDAKDKEAEILKQRQEAYLEFSMQIGQSFGDLIADSEATFGDYLKNVLIMSLEALHQFLLIGMAKTWIQAATEGAPINPLAVAKAMAKIVVMEAAYQGVKGLLSKGKQSGGFSSTDGPDNQPDGVYHKNEFIASAPAVRNPTIKPILNVIDLAQKQGTIASLNLPAVMASMGMLSAGKQSGGFSSTSTGSAAGSLPEREAVEGRSVSKGSMSDPALTDAINLNTKAIAMLMKNGVSFPMVAGIKKMKEVEDLISQTGMGGFGK